MDNQQLTPVEIVLSPTNAPGIPPILMLEAAPGEADRLMAQLPGGQFRILTARSEVTALDILSREKVALILLAAAPTRTALEPQIDFPEMPLEAAALLQGLEWCHLLKESPLAEDVPLLLISSLAAPVLPDRALEAGADYLLYAPYEPEALLETIRLALLNAPLPPAEAGLPVETRSPRRTYRTVADRGRLARLLFSQAEDLQRCKLALARRSPPSPERPALPRQTVQGLVHDFLNILDAVSTAVALSAPEGAAASHRQAMDAALAQAQKLVAELEDFALLEEASLPLESMDPVAAVQQALDAAMIPLLAPGIRVQVQTAGLPPVWIHPALLLRALHNLIWNAVQAMPAGGVLTISGFAREDRVFLEVSDTGPGVPEKNRERIFEARFSTKGGHSGMGLAVVRYLMERGGGEILLASRPGPGSTFLLSLPAADAAPSAPSGVPKEQVFRRSGSH